MAAAFKSGDDALRCCHLFRQFLLGQPRSNPGLDYFPRQCEFIRRFCVRPGEFGIGQQSGQFIQYSFHGSIFHQSSSVMRFLANANSVSGVLALFLTKYRSTTTFFPLQAQ